MGFPTWTLWGMGLSAACALLVMLLAYVGQSPHLMQRWRFLQGLTAARVRTLTGCGVACLFLALGFFLAGVPLDSDAALVAVDEPSVVSTSPPAERASTSTPAPAVSEANRPNPTSTLSATRSEASTPESGAFGRPVTISTTTPTAPATSLPTTTPSPTAVPTLTPTPITVETALVDLGGGTVWMRLSPGGQTVQLLQDGALVIPTNGRANLNGALWQEIRSVNGVLGWIQRDFLTFSTEEDTADR